MIVLDEQLQGRQLEQTIANWYHGSVCSITHLRPGTIIKDDAIPGLLAQCRRPVFVTINVNHFWKRIAPDQRFCVACFNLLDTDAPKISRLLKLLFRESDFGSKAQRAGHVFRINIDERVQYYSCRDAKIQTFQL